MDLWVSYSITTLDYIGDFLLEEPIFYIVVCVFASYIIDIVRDLIK